MAEDRTDKEGPSAPRHPFPGESRGKIRLEAYGQEMVEKEVKLSGSIGRVYLPRHWVGSRVKIIRLD